MQKNIESYFTDGCGRCAKGGTPDCKVLKWENELALLRQLVLDCGLIEEIKWGVPCYTVNKKNVLIVAAFKEYASVSFFKGALLSDEEKILIQPAEDSQASRVLKFTSTQQIINLENQIKAYIFEAVELEKSGAKISYKSTSEFDVPEEFAAKLNEMPLLKTAFEKLTPGRQRGYLLHIAQAKQVKTRETRIEKCIPLILAGKGIMEK